MTDPQTGSGDSPAVDPDDSLGFEGYPYASVEAEKRIKLITSLLSVVAVVVLVAGLYLALFTPNIGIGGILSVVGFFDLMFVPFIAKRMRRAALVREGGPLG